MVWLLPCGTSAGVDFVGCGMYVGGKILGFGCAIRREAHDFGLLSLSFPYWYVFAVVQGRNAGAV